MEPLHYKKHEFTIELTQEQFKQLAPVEIQQELFEAHRLRIEQEIYRSFMGYSKLERWTQRIGDVEVQAEVCPTTAVAYLSRIIDWHRSKYQ